MTAFERENPLVKKEIVGEMEFRFHYISLTDEEIPTISELVLKNPAITNHPPCGLQHDVSVFVEGDTIAVAIHKQPKDLNLNLLRSLMRVATPNNGTAGKRIYQEGVTFIIKLPAN